MPKTIIKLPTWRCSECDYAQDFNPSDESLMKLHFPSCIKDLCPACFMGENTMNEKKQCLMVKETNSDKKTTITIDGEEELDIQEIETEEKDQDGKNIKRKLTHEEKEEKRLKIRADIVKFRALEDK